MLLYNKKQRGARKKLCDLNFCQARLQWKALRVDKRVRRDQVQKSPKALWIRSSDFRHTQYAFPKKGNALLYSFTFQVSFTKM